jgi:cell division protease FtsH
LKVTVIPRGNSLGATWSVPDEERVHVTNEVLEAKLAGMLGGRIAEEVNYGTLGAGALSDLERSTKITYAMVAYYGMSKKIGPISYYDAAGTRDTFTKPYSEQTAMAIDDEVRRILEEAYAHAREIIEANNDKINAMADLLLEKETIYAEDIETILGPSAQSKKEAKEKNAAKKADTAVEITDEPSVAEPIVAPATENNTDSKN